MGGNWCCYCLKLGATSADWYGSGQYVLTGRVKIGGQNGGSYLLMLTMGVHPPPPPPGLFITYYENILCSLHLCKIFHTIFMFVERNHTLKLFIKA